MLNMLKFKLLPNTLFAWVDMIVQFWDEYADFMNMHKFNEQGDISLRKFAY